MYLSLSLSIYIYIYIHVCMYVSIYPSLSLSIYIYICMYIYIYIYIYIFITYTTGSHRCKTMTHLVQHVNLCTRESVFWTLRLHADVKPSNLALCRRVSERSRQSPAHATQPAE